MGHRISSSLTLLFVIVMGAFTSTSAHAVDGVVLINQTTVIAGLPGCPTGGNFPIIICQSGSYELSGNLQVTASKTDAIDIKAKNVSLNLNGFTITGPVTCTGFGTSLTCTGLGGYGIQVFSNAPNCAIRNGTIQGFYYGILMFADISLGGIVEGVIANNNSAVGIQAFNSVVRRNNSSYNGYGGINANGSTITDNVASYNFDYGVDCTGCKVTENVLNGNGTDGLVIINGLYGGNTLEFNSGGTVLNISATSQNNNDCGTGSPC
jgi:hypothetical protein